MGFRSYQPSELTQIQVDLGRILARLWKWKMLNEEGHYAGRRVSAERPQYVRLNRVSQSILQKEIDYMRDGLRQAQNKASSSPSKPSAPSASADKWDLEEQMLMAKQPTLRSPDDLPSHLNSAAYREWNQEVNEFRGRRDEARKQAGKKELP